MSRVLKFTLSDHGLISFPMPAGARVLSVADQCGALQLWALAEDSAGMETRSFATVFTGFDQVAPEGVFVGTVLSSGGNIVRHVFDVTAKTGEKHE